ncbi:MAG: helix-turn-helix domain-containing protein [Phycisphaerae bacterium]|nr:helix-turn-helix domain-containing protein [Phycisphaerae bacterium]
MTDTKAKLDQLLDLVRSLAFDLIDQLQRHAAESPAQKRSSQQDPEPPSDASVNPQAQPAPTELLWSPRQAAKSLSICERTLWSLTSEGQIRCIRIGRIVRYDPADLRAWIDRKKAEASG